MHRRKFTRKGKLVDARERLADVPTRLTQGSGIAQSASKLSKAKGSWQLIKPIKSTT